MERKWFFCVVVVSLECLPCSSECQGSMGSILPEIYPVGMIQVLHGNPLDIYCVNKNYSAKELEFKNGAVKLSWKEVNTTTITLHINRHQKGTFVYFCRNKVTNKYCTTRVLVDSAPGDVTDFTCKSKNLEVLNCTWTSPVSFGVANYYLLSQLIDGVIVNECHPVKINRTKNYCSWNNINPPRYTQQEKEFFFNLKSQNVFGSIEQNFTIDHFSIIKPDPPENLKVIGNGTHSVLLQWGISANMVDFLPNGVDHKIEYQIAKIDNTAYFRQVNTSGLPPRNKTYRFLLSDLPYAHMQYEVRIYIRPKEAVEDEFWSEFTYQVFYTASERPNRPPDTVVGAFDQNPFETKRRIYVYWKQLEEYEEGGANFTYKVVAHQGTGNPKTFLADNNKSLSYVILEDASLGAINVDIWSTNDNGSSLNKSQLFIPPNTDTVALRVISFTKLAYENGTYKLSWIGIDKIDNYTVFWCQQNTTKICAGRMNFTVLEPNKTSHVIDLPRENRYQFAISANNKTKTSGMVWATCDISKEGILMYGFPVKLDHGAAGKSSVKITWTMTCTLQEGIITGYLISYCPVKDTSNVCDPAFGKSIVSITDPNQMQINLTQLKPYRTYQISLALNTTYGQKTIENASTRVTTTEDTPSSPRNISITNVGSNSIVISWDPPLERNGIIGKYVIYNYKDEFTSYTVHQDDNSMKSLKLEGLMANTYYSWSVRACTTMSCSQKVPAKGILVSTRMGSPRKLKSPTFDKNSDSIYWISSDTATASVDHYQLSKTDEDGKSEVFNTSKALYALGRCSGLSAYRVRAVSIEETPARQKLQHAGEWSAPLTVNCKREDAPYVILISSILGVAVLIVMVYQSIKCYKTKKLSQSRRRLSFN